MVLFLVFEFPKSQAIKRRKLEENRANSWGAGKRLYFSDAK